MSSVPGLTSSIGPAASANSVFNNPQLLSAMLPGYNISALDQAMQAQLNVDQIPLTQMSSQLSTLQGQASAWKQIQTDLTALQSDAASLGGTSLYQGLSPTTSNAADVTAAASGSGGPTGTYQVVVTSLMQPEIDESAPQTSATAALGYSGKFTINGTSVSVSSSNSLQDIASAINAAGAGVTATVLQPVGSGPVLNVASVQGKAITWTDPSGILQGLGLLTSGAAPADQLQAAAEAKYTINDVAEQSPTNGDATSIPGVTLSFLQPTGSSGVTVTTSQNQGAVTGAVGQFAADYNALLSDLQKFAGQGGVLEGDASALGIGDMLSQTLGAAVASQPSGYDSLAQIGVTVSAPVGSPNNLTMSVDSSKLQAALTADPGAVASLFNSAAGGIATQLSTQLGGFAGATGSVTMQISALGQQISNLSSQVNDPNSPINQQIALQSQQVETEFQNMLTALMQGLSQGQQLQGFMNSQYGASSNSSQSGSGG